MLLYIILFAVAVLSGLLYLWYRNIQKPTHAGGIVLKKEGGRTLFLIVTSSSSKSKWVLPKGRIEKNESPEFAAVREVMEEAGVSAKPVKKAGTIKFNKKGSRVIVVYFLMDFIHFYDTSAENRKLAWVEKDEAVIRLGFTGTRNILRKI